MKGHKKFWLALAIIAYILSSMLVMPLSTQEFNDKSIWIWFPTFISLIGSLLICLYVFYLIISALNIVANSKIVGKTIDFFFNLIERFNNFLDKYL
jgi:hypothetical protein